MTEPEVRQVFESLKERHPSSLQLIWDGFGNLEHAEIHSDHGLLWKWPANHPVRVNLIRPSKFYGAQHSDFKVDGPPNYPTSMEYSGVV